MPVPLAPAICSSSRRVVGSGICRGTPTAWSRQRSTPRRTENAHSEHMAALHVLSPGPVTRSHSRVAFRPQYTHFGAGLRPRLQTISGCASPTSTVSHGMAAVPSSASVTSRMTAPTSARGARLHVHAAAPGRRLPTWCVVVPRIDADSERHLEQGQRGLVFRTMEGGQQHSRRRLHVVPQRATALADRLARAPARGSAGAATRRTSRDTDRRSRGRWPVSRTSCSNPGRGELGSGHGSSRGAARPGPDVAMRPCGMRTPAGPRQRAVRTRGSVRIAFGVGVERRSTAHSSPGTPHTASGLA